VTFALGSDAVTLAVELVATPDDLLGGCVVVGIATVAVVEVGEVARDVVVVLASVVVVLSCTTFARWCTSGVVFEPLSVKTRTSRRRGLDHISRCAPRIENR
jgi:hypothetical protein